ncbi:MAG: hypothetical protein J6P77_04400 [Acetobacter sp.]|nr:hypothetical protein [Acetobacter sp.]
MLCFKAGRRGKKQAQEQKALNNLRAKASVIATDETCSDSYLKAHPNFLKDHLPIDKNVLRERDVSYAFYSACVNFKNAKDKSIRAEAKKVVTKQMCSIDYLKAHPEILRAYPDLTRRSENNSLFYGGAYTYFGDACLNLGLSEDKGFKVDEWVDNKYNHRQ